MYQYHFNIYLSATLRKKKLKLFTFNCLKKYFNLHLGEYLFLLLQLQFPIGFISFAKKWMTWHNYSCCVMFDVKIDCGPGLYGDKGLNKSCNYFPSLNQGTTRKIKLQIIKQICFDRSSKMYVTWKIETNIDYNKKLIRTSWGDSKIV